MQVGAVALEEAMRSDGQEDVEVAGWSTANASFAFADEPDAGAVLNTGRDVDRERALPRQTARAKASSTWSVDHSATPLTGCASALKREHALRITNTTGSAALGTHLWPRTDLGT